MNAIIMNAKGGNMHGKEEYIELDSLKKLQEIYEEVIL